MIGIVILAGALAVLLIVFFVSCEHLKDKCSELGIRLDRAIFDKSDMDSRRTQSRNLALDLEAKLKEITAERDRLKELHAAEVAKNVELLRAQNETATKHLEKMNALRADHETVLRKIVDAIPPNSTPPLRFALANPPTYMTNYGDDGSGFVMTGNGAKG
jgi:septal ring factor EnvC (AmiA/AmiB activator)